MASPTGDEIPAEGTGGRPPKPHRFRPLDRYRQRWDRRKSKKILQQKRAAEVRHALGPDATLEEKLDFLNARMTQMRFAEYVAMWENPKRMFWVNLVSGMGRGLGYGIGFAFLTGVAIYILQKLIAANLPYLSDWLATIIQLVDQKVKP